LLHAGYNIIPPWQALFLLLICLLSASVKCFVYCSTSVYSNKHGYGVSYFESHSRYFMAHKEQQSINNNYG
jgi:hypothetical protein